MMKLYTLIALLLLASCTSVSETPLSANVWQINVEGRGGIGASQVDSNLVKRAAELTLEQGFDKFFLSSPETRDQIINAGNTPISSNTTATIYGNTIYGNTQYSGGDPVLVRIKSSSVLVAMFSSDDPRAVNAIDARRLLQKQPGS